MQPLPIDPYLPLIVESLRSRGALVLVGPPGSGKTTRVPPAILEGALHSRGRILVLQPRRIAARAAAAWIAAERGWTLGREVGYTVRFENRTTRETRIQVVTEGILTRRLQGDPFLRGVSAVVLDEFHERSIHSDLAIALLREVRRAGRDDLLLVVMSATLDPGPVSSYLGGCPVMTVEGRPYPVEVRHVETGGLVRPEEAATLAARAVRDAWDKSRGNVLVFLPGIGEIRRALRELDGFAGPREALLLPLHGGLTLEEQQAALEPSARRKIVLSTNIAETSLTIEGVDLVVDSGFARVLRNDPRHGIDRLEVTRISRHSAEQRAGRAGRLGPGKAIRLWSLREHESLLESEAPEIRRIDLAATVLELHAWGVADPARFSWFEAPDPAALERAEDLLVTLGALEKGSRVLTPVGKTMLEIPAHPRISRILVSAHEEGALEEAALLAALLEERDILPLSAGGLQGSLDRGRLNRGTEAMGVGGPGAPGKASTPGRIGGPAGTGRTGGVGGAGGTGPTRQSRGERARDVGPSDLLVRRDLFEEAETTGFRRGGSEGTRIDLAAARAVARARDALLADARQALRQLRQPKGGPPSSLRPGSRNDEALLRVLLSGFPDRVVRRRSKGSDRGRMVGGRGVALVPESVVRDEEFFLALDLDEGQRAERADARVSIASAVRRRWIEEDLAAFVAEVTETFFDQEAGKVRSTATLSYRDLPLEDPRDRRPPPEAAEKLLSEAARARAQEIFDGNEAAKAWLARVRSLAGWMPELGLSGFGADELGRILAGACAGKTSLAELGEMDLLGLLEASLPHVQVEAVEAHAPEAIRVPSGSRIRLSYEPGRPPVLAVRLQEMFGLAETPTVAASRVPVLLHLLGPNFRPVQITQDLRSFWKSTYAQVRKDLRARYPKHAWPEDPWAAQPVAGPRKRLRG